MAENSSIEWTDHTSLSRFRSKVVIGEPDECWVWTGATLESGYGIFFFNADGIKNTTAHRASFIFANGPIAQHLKVDHRCRNRGCVNPRHLEAVTNRENTLRGLRGRLITVCKNGHPYTPETTGRKTTGQRICLLCRRAHDKGRGRDAKFWRNYRNKRKEKVIYGS